MLRRPAQAPARRRPRGLGGLGGLLIALALGLGGCKVGLTDVDAGFVVADATWFAEEATLFVFYEVQAAQGLGAESQIELRYVTDDGVVDWTPLDAFAPVHRHLPVDCGPNTRCGSTSVTLPLPPREVALRLRYHREGSLTLDPETRLNLVGPGDPHTNRSLLVYGVFTADDRSVQWRARHVFPTLRNQEVERLGLRRRFIVDDIGTEASPPELETNAYRYGAPCPAPRALGWGPVETDARAAFSDETLPDDALADPALCAQATVFDANGPFTTTAVARKNPEVRPAFPLLRSPIREVTPLHYLLAPCRRTISASHRAMQIQRLLMDGVEPFCLDDAAGDPLDADTLIEALDARLQADVEAARAEGGDLVIALALHHDANPTLSATLERGLAPLLSREANRNTPRVVGAFVLDSYAYTVADPAVGARALWCPSELDPDLDPETISAAALSSLVCALPAADLRLSLGPFDLGALPILPDRRKYLDFIDLYSDAEAGEMTRLTYTAPELPPDADAIAVPPLGSATFFNDEAITAAPSDAFSFCDRDADDLIVYRLPGGETLLPLSALPLWHAVFPSGRYELGLVWDFPFRLRLEYETVAALAVSAFSASLPLGLAIEQTADYGSAVWDTGEFSLAESLVQCVRRCDFPTFDAAGIYQVNDPFRATYQTACYAPRYPTRADSGFPLDP